MASFRPAANKSLDRFYDTDTAMTKQRVKVRCARRAPVGLPRTRCPRRRRRDPGRVPESPSACVLTLPVQPRSLVGRSARSTIAQKTVRYGIDGVTLLHEFAGLRMSRASPKCHRSDRAVSSPTLWVSSVSSHFARFSVNEYW